MEIADSVIERLCLSLIIPVVRPNSVKVFSHILCSAQSKKLFMKIVPRIPKVFQSIQSSMNGSNDSSIPPDVQLFIDLVSAFVHRYGEYDLDFSEIVSCFDANVIEQVAKAKRLLFCPFLDVHIDWIQSIGKCRCIAECEAMASTNQYKGSSDTNRIG